MKGMGFGRFSREGGFSPALPGLIQNRLHHRTAGQAYLPDL
jgi:hypothetical protein